jgi:hypothetical protein
MKGGLTEKGTVAGEWCFNVWQNPCYPYSLSPSVRCKSLWFQTRELTNLQFRAICKAWKGGGGGVSFLWFGWLWFLSIIVQRISVLSSSAVAQSPTAIIEPGTYISIPKNLFLQKLVFYMHFVSQVSRALFFYFAPSKANFHPISWHNIFNLYILSIINFILWDIWQNFTFLF